MSSPATRTPHDLFFKSAMKDIRVAREFLESYLPDFIRAEFDFNSLSLCDGHYVHPELRALSSDVLYRGLIQEQEIYIYALCEHQSTVDPKMPFRVWEYLCSIWHHYFKQHPEEHKLPLIVPLVFYHGRQPYTASCDLKDLIQAPQELIDRVLYQPFTLIDTHELPDEALKAQQWAGTMAFVMKHIYVPEILIPLQAIQGPLKQCYEAGGESYLTSEVPLESR